MDGIPARIEPRSLDIGTELDMEQLSRAPYAHHMWRVGKVAGSLGRATEAAHASPFSRKALPSIIHLTLIPP
ncbi:unnamed protein product [Allacma fusca]|uniref:Uncharacterized protein n=1 Tax=Allacma fusca TaxID=39272 RepID=A0A8J2J474_9HEXA|nr:unnamed protein product [Allacma fusca]